MGPRRSSLDRASLPGRLRHLHLHCQVSPLGTRSGEGCSSAADACMAFITAWPSKCSPQVGAYLHLPCCSCNTSYPGACPRHPHGALSPLTGLFKCHLYEEDVPGDFVWSRIPVPLSPEPAVLCLHLPRVYWFHVFKDSSAPLEQTLQRTGTWFILFAAESTRT